MVPPKECALSFQYVLENGGRCGMADVFSGDGEDHVFRNIGGVIANALKIARNQDELKPC